MQFYQLLRFDEGRVLSLLYDKEAFVDKKKVNLPKKDAGRRLAERLAKIGLQKPPQSLVQKINAL